MNILSSRNECYTYFSIYGNFNVKDLCNILGIVADESWQANERADDGTIHDESYLSCNKCENYNIFTSKQMEETISPFENKVDLLVELKNKYNLKYCLEVVPFLHVGEISPALAPNSKIVEFCFKTGTEIDIDLYVEE